MYPETPKKAGVIVIDGTETGGVKAGIALTGLVVIVGVVVRLVESGSNGFTLVQGAYKQAKAGTKTPAVPEIKVASATEPIPDWANPGRRYEHLMSRQAE